MTIARHAYKAREVGFFVEAALSPLSTTSVEWDDKQGVVEIYTTPDPLHTLRDIANWTKFTKPGSSGSFDVPAGTRKVAIEATSSPVVGEPLLLFAQGARSFRMLFAFNEPSWPDSVIELDDDPGNNWRELGFNVGDIARVDNTFLMLPEFEGDYEIISFNVASGTSGTTNDPWARVRRVDGKTIPEFDDPGLADFYIIPKITSGVFPTAVVVSDGLTNMEQARIYGVDQLDASVVPPPAPLPGTPFANFDWSDLSTLFQTAGTGSPVTTHGQAIHHIVDIQANMSDANANFGTTRTWDSAFGGIGGGDLVASNWVSTSVPSTSSGEWTILVVAELQSNLNGGWWAYAGVPALNNLIATDEMFFATSSGDIHWDQVGEETPYGTLFGLIIQADAGSILGYRSDISGSEGPDAAWVFEELDGVGAMSVGPFTGDMTWGQLVIWDSQPTIPEIKDYAGDKWSFAWA